MVLPGSRWGLCWSSLAVVVLMVMTDRTVFTQNVPTILSQSRTVEVVKGQAGVVLECLVSNLGSNSISWTLVDTNTLIYRDGQLMTDNHVKYSIIQPPDSSAYNLQLLDVSTSDQGFYRCQIEGTTQSINVHLDVEEMPDRPDYIPQGTLNHTDCCVAQNVSSQCLDACVPANLNAASFLLQCQDDSSVEKLMKCLTAGSNHESCCLFRGLAPICTPFCRNELPETIGPEHLVCITDASVSILTQCAEEGFATLPNEPQNVAVVPYNDGSKPSLTVKWQPPTRNADKVIGYKIMYKRSDMNTYYSQTLQSGNIVRISDHIESNSGYDVHIAAMASHGASGASVEVSVFVPNASLNANQNSDIDACCQLKKVSDTCRSELCHSRSWSGLNMDSLAKCSDSLDDVFSCLAGQQDHTACCQAFEVPSVCLPVCSGNPPPFNASLGMCIQEMAVIEACVQQGYDKLPKPPYSLVLQEVTSTSVNLNFVHSPSSGVTRYVVYLKAGQDEDGSGYREWATLIPSDNSAFLNDLSPYTYYSVRITAETASYGSLPSETVHFLTYPASAQAPTVQPVVNIPHNFSECCYAKMPEVCAQGCEYVQSISAYYQQHLAVCYSHIGTVLSCASDGRNHRECCAERDVTNPVCLDLCGIAQDGELDEKYIQCLPDTPKAVLCFGEGIAHLPRYPDIFVSNVSQNTIYLTWIHPPTSTPIDTYIIKYKKTSDPVYKQVTTQKTELILQNLIASTEYQITAQGRNSNGTSAPSPLILQYTQEANKETPDFNTTQVTGRQYWANITDCCQSGVIPAQCIDQCLNQQSDALNSYDCTQHNPAMLACYANGKDHGECCQTNPELPSSCVAICRGHATQSSTDTALCMGLKYRDIILSCYLTNAGLIPSPPTNVDVTLKEGMKVEVTWLKASEYCGADCQSVVHYWRQVDSTTRGQQDVKMVSGVNSPYTVTLTGGEGFFTFLVTARNSYGGSAPSSRRTLFVSPYEKDVKVTLLSNTPYVVKGQNAVLQCSATDFNPADPFSIKWSYNTRRHLASTSQELYLINVNPDSDEGTYTCQVTDSSVTVTDSLFLPIQYAPQFSFSDDSSVVPNQGLTASMTSWFHGFPESAPQMWQLNGKDLNFTDSKYSASNQFITGQGLKGYRLQVMNVLPSDYGVYSINVSNYFGSTKHSIKLMNPNEVTVIQPAPKVSDHLACCKKEGVSELCQELCYVGVDVADIVADPKYSTCLTQFTSLIKCSADGKDHSKCCKNKAVKPYCLPFCAGKSPDSAATNPLALLDCVSEAETIFSCIEEGMDFLPYPPTDVTAMWWNQGGSIQVRWSRPQFNHDRVQSYVIFYKSNSNSTEHHESINSQMLEYYITDVKKVDSYQISVTASNNKGSSQRSDVVAVKPYTINPPTNLQVRVSGTTATLSWDPPANMIANRLQYTVHYKAKYDTRYLKLTASGVTYVISQLLPDDRYSAYVTALSEDMVQSAPSNYVDFSIGDDTSFSTPAPTPDNQGRSGGGGGDNDKAAIAVGVVVAILAVVAIAVIIILIYKGRLNKQAGPTESVSFENPMNADSEGVKIQGMGRNDDQFNYGRLEEEATYDNSPSYPSPPIVPNPEGAYVNPSYAGQEMEGASAAAATLEVNSEA